MMNIIKIGTIFMLTLSPLLTSCTSKEKTTGKKKTVNKSQKTTAKPAYRPGKR